MPYFTGLARVARTTGFPVVEIPGWKKRGHGAFASCQSIICHHTAGSAKGNYPSLNVVAYGRAGLAGPLSQFGLGRDGTIYVIAAGWAAHAGKDSLVRPAHARNLYSIGIEAENTGVGEPWPAVQMESYVRLVRALVDEFGLDVSRVYGHKEVAYTESGRLGRKPDPAGINMDTFRAAVKRGTWSANVKTAATPAASTTTPEEFTVSQIDDIAKATASATAQAVADIRIPVTRSGEATTRDLVTLVSSIDGQGIHNTAEIAELKGIVEKLAEKAGLTAAEVEAAAVRGSQIGAEKAIAAGIEIEGTVQISKKEK